MALEKVFRPYQLPDTTPPRISTTQPPGDSSPVVLLIGKGGTAKIMNGSYSASVTTYHEKMEAERTS